MSDIYAATDGTAGGTGSESAPYDLDTALTAAASGDRVLVMPGIYAQAATVATNGVTVEGHFTGRPIIYGGAEITGTWSLHSGNVWKITTAAPVALILRTRSDLMLKGEWMDSLGEVVAETQWFHMGGVLYLYSGDGDPSVAFWRVDKVSLQGTESGIYATAFGGLYIDNADDVTLRNLSVRGFRGNGHMADESGGHTLEACDLSFNSEDGGGGFAMPDCTASECTFDWNGTRRVRLGELGSTDGDGFSLHDLGVLASTNFTIKDCTGEGNCKDLTQNIHTATGTVERCKAVNCGFGLVGNTTGAQTFRNVIIDAGDLGVGCFGLVFGTHTMHNVTAIGRDQASSVAIISVLGAGSLTVRNSIFTRWATGAAMSTSTFVHTYNCWDVTTLGLTLGTGEIQADPLLVGSRLGLASDSPCLGTGTSLAATFTDDRYGRGRFSTWSMGAVERTDPTPRGRALEALCVALERIGDESQDWQTLDRLTGVVRYGRSSEGAVAPFIAPTDVSETYERVSTSGVYQRTLRASFVYSASSWEGFDFLGSVAHDVELAVGTDRTLGGVVDDATFVSNASRVDGSDYAVTFTIELRYRTQDSSPMTRV